VSSSGSITPLSLDSELLGELLEKLPAGVVEQLTHNWRKQSEALARSERENRLLRELLRLMRVEKYGPASERLSDEQLELLEQEPGMSEAEVKAESERAQLQLPLKGPKQRPARQSLPAELPRIEQLIACSGQECVCGACGREKVVIGLGHFNGILQTDGYSGYDRVGGPKLIHAGCWAHARRYFFQAVEAHPDDRAAIALVATIDELFAIDAQARERNLTVTERIAAIISIVEICRRLKIPIRDYLAAILPGLADFPANRLHQLTPAAWCLETN
jgi:hypothetical protein